MREILFRGKRVDTGEWAESEKYMHCIEISSGKELYYLGSGGLMAELEDEFGNVIKLETAENKPLFYKVIPETVGQYTGLKDKNGKRIFEGDILNCEDRIVVVAWHKYCGAWDSNFIRYVRERCSNGINNSEWKYRATIIGSIHDNPELLSGGCVI